MQSAGATGSSGFSLASLLDGEAGALQDPKREAAVHAAQIPHTILRVGQIRDTPGGAQELRFSQVQGPRASSGTSLVRTCSRTAVCAQLKE